MPASLRRTRGNRSRKPETPIATKNYRKCKRRQKRRFGWIRCSRKHIARWGPPSRLVDNGSRLNKVFRRAIEIDPNSSAAHGHFSRFYYWPLGRITEAVREARAAVRNDPLSPLAHSELCDVLLTAGGYDEAASQCQNVPAGNEWEWGRVCLGRARFGQGRTAEAIRVLSAVKEWGYLAYVYAKSGRRAEAEKLIAEAPIRYTDRRGPHQFAVVFAGFGDRDHTIERLESLARAGPVRLGFTLNSPEFAFVRGDPRLKTLRKKVGLPE